MKGLKKTAIFPTFHLSNKPDIQVFQPLFKTLDLLERAKLFIEQTRIKISKIQNYQRFWSYIRLGFLLLWIRNRTVRKSLYINK